MTGEPLAAGAGAGWSGATGAATAATSCTPGIAVLFLGRGRLVGLPRAARRAALARRDASQSGDYTRHLRASRPRALGGDRAGTGAPISLGAVLRRAQGRRALHAAPVAQLLPDPGPVEGRDRRASSRARPPARSTCAGGCGATSGWPCGPTSPRSRSRSARPTAASPTPAATCQALRDRRAGRALPHATRRRRPSGRSSRRSSRGSGSAARSCCWARWWPPGRRPRRACGACAASTRRALGRELVARLASAWSTRSPSCVLAALVALVVRARRCGGRARRTPRDEARARRARGRQGGQVPRDPRRRARPPAWASSPRTTGATSTASCAPRRSRSCAARRAGGPDPLP